MEKPYPPDLKQPQIQQLKQDESLDSYVCLSQQSEFVQKIKKINGQIYTRTYKKLQLLGKGGFALCYKTQQMQSDSYAATKIIKKKSLQNFRTKLRLQNQIRFHKTLRHENVVKLYNHFEDDANVYINLELCQNGSLVDLLRFRINFSTPEIQSFMHGICEGVRYLHANKLIHRDLKLGNLFLNKQNIIKIGDFGLASKLQFQKQCKRTICGTPNYLAPEVLFGKGYNFEIDIWAIGIILYSLYFITPPFQTEQAKLTYELIKNCNYSFPKQHQAPPQALDLIKRILVKNPADRPTLDQILQSSFMRIGGSIPRGLPPCIVKRAPNKKQLSNWSSIVMYQQQHKKSQKSFFGFNQKNKKQFSIISPEMSLDQRSLKKIENKSEQKVHVKILDEINDKLIFYALSNGNYGIQDRQSHIFYNKNIFRPHQKQTSKIIWVNNSTWQKQMFPDTQCIHRVMLNIKVKQLVGNNIFSNRQIDCQQVYPTKINTFKQILMVRLTNRTIQLIYPQKDSFVITCNRNGLLYYKDMTDDKQLQIINQDKLLQSQSNKQNCNQPLKFKKGHRLNSKKIGYARMLLMEMVAPKK